MAARTRRLTRATRAAMAAVVAIGLAVAITSTDDASAASGGGLQRLLYALLRPVCPPPTATHWSCMAVERVQVAKGTPGAIAYAEPAEAHGQNGGYSPHDISGAYRFNPAIGGSTQTVAIVMGFSHPNILSDLNTFNSGNGIRAETATSFRVVNQRGASSPLPVANRGTATEIALDVETIRGLCHKCKILLVEADDMQATSLAAAVNTAARLGATEISNSYGGPEVAGSPTYSYRHPGIVITASTGDDGWYDWDAFNEGKTSSNVPNWPSALPGVVAVGGTRLSLSSTGARAAERAWNSNGVNDRGGLGLHQALGASGGGCSRLVQAPPWQVAVSGYSSMNCSTRRLATDIAADADPATGFDIFDSYGVGGWATVGGTSLSAPIIAAMFALAGGARGVRFPAATLYDNFKFRPSTLYDVRSGSTGFCGGPGTSSCIAAIQAAESGGLLGLGGNDNNGNSLDCAFTFAGNLRSKRNQCIAIAGYDGASGVGAPNGLAVFTPR